MGNKRKNLKISEETYEELNEQRHGIPWDDFLSLMVEIDSIDSIRDYLADNMGRDRPDREVIDVFVSLRDCQSHAYWEMMADEDIDQETFAQRMYQVIDTALADEEEPWRFGMASQGNHFNVRRSKPP